MDSSALTSPMPQYDRLFGELKTRSTAYLTEPSVESISAFRQFVARPEVSATFLRPLAHYLVYPIRFIIENLPQIVQKSQKPTSSELLLLQSLDCLDLIFTKIGTLANEDIFDTFFSMLIFLLGQDDDGSAAETNTPPKLVPHITEDLTTSLLQCLYSLLRSCDQQLFSSKLSQSDQFTFKLGYFVNLLLKLAQQPKQYHEIQSRSLNLLSTFYLKSVRLQLDAFDFNIKINDVDCAVQFAAFTLPSVVSTTAKLVQLCSGHDYHKLHQSVIIAALKLFAIIIAITFNAKQTFPDEVKSEQVTPQMSTPQVHFNQKWFDDTTTRLCPIIGSVIDILLEHPNQEVRDALLKLTTSLLLYSCFKFTLRFIKVLLRVPVAFHDDPHCQQFITRFQSQIGSSSLDESLSLTNVLHEELFAHIKRLPFLFRHLHLNASPTNSPDNLVSSFQTLSGFIHILKPEGFYQFLKIEQHKYELFRSLINLAEFNCATKLHFTIQDLDHNAVTSPAESIFQPADLFNSFELDKHLIFLTDKPVLKCYLACVQQLGENINYDSFQIIYDHLLQLLYNSNFDPSVLLLLNMLLSGLHRRNQPEFEPYFTELLQMCQQQLDISQLYYIESEERLDLAPINDSQTDTLKSMPLFDLATICAPTNGHFSDDLVSTRLDQPKAKRLNRYIFRYSLLLQAITYSYTLLHQLNRIKYRGEFFRTSFCHFLEAYSCEYQLVSSVTHRLLLFIGIQFECGNGDVAKMVAENLNYLYNSLTVTLDYSVLHQVDSNQLDQVYQIDRYSLKTVQVSLETILKLLLRLHQSSKSINFTQLDYLHRLVEQILNIIKYYSIRPLPRYSANLNRLLTILYAYLELVEVVCDKNPEPTRRIEDTNQDDTIRTAIVSLEDYVKSYRFLMDQTKMDFKNDTIGEDEDHQVDMVKAMKEQELEEESKKQSILDSPIVKSRTGHILYHCSLILSDANVDVRLNVLQLACKSMRLLRSYEDILLPYVHKLWDPLVARFSTESDHPVILSRAYSCLLLASEFCGDFLLARTRKDIIPRLVSFLYAQLDHRINYFITHKRKLNTKSVEYFAEHELLSTLGQLMVNLKLKSKDLFLVCPLLLMYVALKPLPSELQKCALESLVELTRYDSGVVRFYLHRIMSLYYQEDVLPPMRTEDPCDCHRVTMLQVECIGKWRKHLHRWNDSLLRDLNGYLQSF